MFTVVSQSLQPHTTATVHKRVHSEPPTSHGWSLHWGPLPTRTGTVENAPTRSDFRKLYIAAILAAE